MNSKNIIAGSLSKNNLFINKLLVFMMLIISYQALSVELPDRPVLSYGWPCTPDNPRTTDTLSTSNMINALHAGWEYLHDGTETTRSYWKNQGKIVLMTADYDFSTSYTQTELNSLFTTNLSLYDGLAINELNGHYLDSDQVEQFIIALEYVRIEYSDKLIVLYDCTNWDSTNPDLVDIMEAIEDYVDLLAVEMYYNASYSQTGNWSYERYLVEGELNKLTACASDDSILDKTTIILGIWDRNIDSLDINYADHIRAQMQCFKNNSTISRTRGIGFFAPYYASLAADNTLEEINKAVMDTILCQLYLRFDEASGTTALDLSACGNDGTLGGFSTSCWVTGKFGGALEFDGDNDSVNCGNDSSLELKEFTYAAWIKPYNVSDDYQQIIGKTNIWDKGLFIHYDNLRGRVPQETTAAHTQKSDIITANEWQHVAMTYKDNIIKLYLNGQLLAPSTATNGVGDITSTANNNMNISHSYYPFKGLMDDVRVYGNALSANDIANIYNDAPLQLRLRLDNSDSIVDYFYPDSTMAKDSSGFYNDGILGGFSTSTCWVDGISGRSLEFDGVNDSVNCGNDSSLELKEFTYVAWIKPYNVSDDYQQIIGKTNIWDKGLFIHYDNLRGHVPQETTAAHTQKSDIITANEWQHVAMTYKDNVIKLYLDGQLLSPSTATTGVGDVTSTLSNNMNLSHSVFPFDGAMDDVRVYSSALSQTAIDYIYKETPYYSVSKSYRLFLKFNESKSTDTVALDISGNANDGTLGSFSTSTCWVAGLSYNALEFDGVNDSINCGNDSSLELEEFTYAVWIRPHDVNAAYQQIIGKTDIWNKGLFIHYDDLRGRVPQATTAAHIRVNNTITANAWQHVAMTYKDNVIKLYHNGQLLSLNASTTGVGSITSTASNTMNISHVVYPFDGLMDDLRVYSVALDATDIELIFQENVPW